MLTPEEPFIIHGIICDSAGNPIVVCGEENFQIKGGTLVYIDRRWLLIDSVVIPGELRLVTQP